MGNLITGANIPEADISIDLGDISEDIDSSSGEYSSSENSASSITNSEDSMLAEMEEFNYNHDQSELPDDIYDREILNNLSIVLSNMELAFTGANIYNYEKIVVPFNKQFCFWLGCQTGDLDLVKWLHTQDYKININASREFAFRSALFNNNLHIAKWLLEMSNINIVGPFRKACRTGDAKIVEWLWNNSGDRTLYYWDYQMR
jgi:hypothetical protein